MPIRQDENQPNKRFGIINLVLIGFGALLLFSSFFPSQNTQVPRVPYSLFINQVDDGEVKRAYITQDQIRYELSTAEEGIEPLLLNDRNPDSKHCNATLARSLPSAAAQTFIK